MTRIRAWWWRFTRVCVLCGWPAVDEHGCRCPRAQIRRIT